MVIGLTFVHAGLLAGLTAVSIPVIIHLLNRLRFKEVEWAAMEFLLEVNKRYRRRLRFEHLLLLFLRMLAVALLVLAVARPVLESAGLIPIPGAVDRTEWIVVLDDSASMAHRSGDRSAFEAAREVTADLVDRIAEKHPGDLVTLFRTSRPELPDVVGQGVGGDRTAQVRKTVLAFRCSDTSFDVAAVLGAVETHLKSDGEARNFALHVITDLCRRDWGGAGGAPASRITRVLERFGKEAEQILLIDVGAEKRDNTGVVDLQSKEKNIVAGVRSSIVASVKNFGSHPAQDVRVTFSAGEVTLPPRTLPLVGPQETVHVAFPFTFPEPGSYPVRVSVSADAFPRDDTRFLATEVRDGVHALVVDGERGMNEEESESFFLSKALVPPGTVASGVVVEVIPDHLLADHELEPYHALFLCNLYRLPKEKIGRIERFVRDGGGLVLFLGDQVEPASFNQDLWAGGEGLSPVRIGDARGVEGEGGFVRFLPEVPDHALTRPFGGVDGLERSFGQGQVVVFTTPCDMEWGRWPTDFSYLLTVQELMRYLPGATSLKWNGTVGARLHRELDASRFEPGAILRTPGYPEEEEKTLIASMGPDGGKPSVRFKEVRRAGFYTLRLTERSGAQVDETHAFNLVPSEGDLAGAEERTLRRVFGPVPFRVVRGRSGLGEKEDGARREIWRSLILALLAVLMVEGFIALRFGHHQPGLAP
jgi:hypothetical protein